MPRALWWSWTDLQLAGLDVLQLPRHLLVLVELNPSRIAVLRGQTEPSIPRGRVVKAGSSNSYHREVRGSLR